MPYMRYTVNRSIVKHSHTAGQNISLILRNTLVQLWAAKLLPLVHMLKVANRIAYPQLKNRRAPGFPSGLSDLQIGTVPNRPAHD